MFLEVYLIFYLTRKIKKFIDLKQQSPPQTFKSKQEAIKNGELYPKEK